MQRLKNQFRIQKIRKTFDAEKKILRNNGNNNKIYIFDSRSINFGVVNL
jgi:hypothetical protein